jgi:hypothetical protein
MPYKLIISLENFESVCDWLEKNPGPEFRVWGVAGDRRAALLAYSDEVANRFCWSEWIGTIFEDPSEILGRFSALEVELDRNVAIKLWSALPWAVTAVPEE